MFAALTLAAAVLASPVPKTAPVEPPKAPPPQLEFVKFDGATTTVHQTIPEAVAVQREVPVTVVVNGQQVTETRTVTVTEIRMRSVPVTLKWDLTQVTFATVGGKKLSAKEAGERLKDGGVCLMATAGQAIEPAYLSVLKDDIVIVTRPAPKTVPDLVQGLTPPPLPPPPPPPIPPPPPPKKM
jgi:hypothetical protein